jgi:hypothetical protein
VGDLVELADASNGTADKCLPSVLNSSEAGNNNQFFASLVAGTGLDQFTQSVFQAAECSGCMYEVSAALYHS